MKRVFSIDIESCEKRGGDVKIIASIENSAIIQKESAQYAVMQVLVNAFIAEQLGDA